jgi:hypothetical protein
MGALVEVSQNPELAQMEENAARRRARITRPKWDPKQWHPVYEEVVLMDCLGLSRKDIALEKGFTEAHITNITQTPQAAIIREVFRRKMAEKYEGTVEDRLERVAQKAMKRIEDTIENDELFKKNPLGLFDRAITVLKATKHIKEEVAQTNNLTLVVTDEQMDKLRKGTELADKAKLLHSGNVNDASTP